MDRRWIGVLVLVLAAFAAVVVTAATGRAVPGSPVATVVPPPPKVGDCLLALSPLSPDRDTTDAETSDADTSDADTTDVHTPIDYPWARYGDCSGPIVGEVTAVDPTEHPLASATVGSYQSASSLCELAEVNYVGSVGPFDPATITTPGIGWQTQVGIASLSIGPNPLQRAGGRSWTACIGATGNGATYRGRIAGALADGVLPPIFATCWTDFRVQQRTSTCTAPHSVEIIAATEITGSAQTVASVGKSCLGMAGRAMRTGDPARGGRLKVGVYTLAEPSYTVLVPVTAAVLRRGDATVSCVASVTAPSRLVGTLIGLGDKPLPLA